MPLMTAILQLLEGPPEQRDCAYHLFLYRCGEFPSVVRPLRSVDDPAAVTSFLEQVVTRDIAGDAPILVADALIASGIFIEFINEEQALGLLQRAVQLLSSPKESVRVLSVILVERILQKYPPPR